MLSLFPEGGKYIVPLSRYGELIDRYFHHRQRSRYCSSCGKYYLDDARTIDAINYIYLCENYDDHVGTHQDEGGQNFYLSVCNEHTRAPKDCQGLGFGPNGFPPTGCHHVPFGGMHKYTAMGCTHGSIDKLVFEDAACEKQAPPEATHRRPQSNLIARRCRKGIVWTLSQRFQRSRQGSLVRQ